MMIVNVPLLNCTATVGEAMRNMEPGSRLLVARYSRRMRMFSHGALQRAIVTVGEDARLDSLPSYSSAPLTALSRSAPTEVRRDIPLGSHSDAVRSYVGGLRRPLLAFARGNYATLVSGSEAYVVAMYRCANGHPYYPPPAWREW